MPKTEIAFNVLLSSDQKAMLSQLSTMLQCSRGQVIRDSIRFRFAHSCNASPTCASGQPCLVPALHQTPAAPPVTMPPPSIPQPPEPT